MPARLQLTYSPPCPTHPSSAAVLRVQTEAFQAANVALGQMKAAALPAPSDMGAPVGVTGSLPGTPDAITAGRDATPPHLQQVRWVAGPVG